jgi:hypothetical protein
VRRDQTLSNSDIEADEALSRSAPSGLRSLMPVVIPTHLAPARAEDCRQHHLGLDAEHARPAVPPDHARGKVVPPGLSCLVGDTDVGAEGAGTRAECWHFPRAHVCALPTRRGPRRPGAKGRTPAPGVGSTCPRIGQEVPQRQTRPKRSLIGTSSGRRSWSGGPEVASSLDRADPEVAPDRSARALGTVAAPTMRQRNEVPASGSDLARPFLPW